MTTGVAGEGAVLNRTALAQYQAKREKWMRWYSLDEHEPNSIERQIASMVFLDMTYCILAEARIDTDGASVAAASGFLANFLDHGYVATQVLAIRRLLDNRSDVISVRRLLKDIKKSRHLLTREIYVSHDGLPYDFEGFLHCHSNAVGTLGLSTPLEGAAFIASSRHRNFDLLCGSLAPNRKRDDIINKRVFERLEEWLDTTVAEKLNDLSNRFFAHASEMNSVGSLACSDILLADISEAQRSIIRVEQAITDLLLCIGEKRDVVPRPPIGFLRGLDRPYSAAGAIAGLEEKWRQLAAEKNSWRSGIAEDLFG